MLIFSDSHHSGLYRSLLLVLQDRLGHELWFPDNSFCQEANAGHPGIWLSPNFPSCGGVPEKHLNERGEFLQVCSKEQFMEKKWDAIVLSRPESVEFLRPLIERHPHRPSIKLIGQAGNEGQFYDWGFIPNFLSSDYLSYSVAPSGINKIHYMQEVGRQFQPDVFTPVTEDDLRTVNTFINCLDSFGDWTWNREFPHWSGRCPHCDGSSSGSFERVSPNSIWHNMKAHLPDHRFMDYGINNSCGSIQEKSLPKTILSGSLTWAFKTYEGMGHSIAQSISMGRVCLVPRRFHRYRTANQFLISNLTCLEAEWKAEDCIRVIRNFTSSGVNRINDFSEGCFNAARGLFNWGHEAGRVKEFLEKLR